MWLPGLTCLLMQTLVYARMGTVMVPSGQIVIEEQVNIDQIKEHLHTWASEASYTDKLEKLLAARKLRESSLLMAHVQQTICGKPGTTSEEQTITTSPTKQLENRVRRQKRNILGDFLHAVTGVATEEQLQAQTRLDAEMRDKVKDALGRQVSFERTITSVYTNISREEERLHERLDRLYNQRAKDRAQLTRLKALEQVAQDDIEVLEDVADSIWQGEVGSRHAIRLVDQAGLPEMAKLKVDSLSCKHNVPMIRYTTMMYQEKVATIDEYDNYKTVQTTATSYLLHKGHPLSHPLSDMEVVMTTGVECPTCALLVHLQKSQYKVVEPGELICTDDTQPHPLQGATFNLPENVTCWNARIKMEAKQMNRKIYTLNTNGRDKMDSLILERDRKIDGGIFTNHTDSNRERQLMTLKFQHDLHLAQQDLDNFMVDTQIDKNIKLMQDATSWGVMGVTGVTVAAISICILVRYISRRKNSMVIVNTPANTPSIPPA